MSAVSMTFEDGIIDETVSKDELVEKIRLESIGEALKHYAFIEVPK